MNKPLDTALAAWLDCEKRDPDDTARQSWVSELAVSGLFSNWHIQAITGVTRYRVDLIAPKANKTGGRFNPQALSLLVDLRNAPARDLARTVVKLGCSPRMIAKLTGIPRTTIQAWMQS